MARWQLTLIDPLNAIPPLVLIDVAEGYNRSIIQQVRLADTTAAGNPIIEGASSPGDRYIWEIQVPLSEMDKFHFEALIDEQQNRLSNFEDGHLLWVDEIEYLPPKPTIRQKPLLAGSSFTVFGKLTGFPIVPVIISVQKTPQHIGISVNGYHKLVEFSVAEVPGAL